ncbi:MAG: SUMF1/EgtB/PvdO family nonheme iron enzyme [Spirochaetota bacterium]|nr:SUMF1/EgtB/PvdO family nonheme iron enzyme [Spirochaetota bacterium]
MVNYGRGAASGTNRVKRGGSWNNNASNCTVANRNNNNPNNQNNNIGFRVVYSGPISQGKKTTFFSLFFSIVRHV